MSRTSVNRIVRIFVILADFRSLSRQFERRLIFKTENQHISFPFLVFSDLVSFLPRQRKIARNNLSSGWDLKHTFATAAGVFWKPPDGIFRAENHLDEVPRQIVSPRREDTLRLSGESNTLARGIWKFPRKISASGGGRSEGGRLGHRVRRVADSRSTDAVKFASRIHYANRLALSRPRGDILGRFDPALLVRSNRWRRFRVSFRKSPPRSSSQSIAGVAVSMPTIDFPACVEWRRCKPLEEAEDATFVDLFREIVQRDIPCSKLPMLIVASYTLSESIASCTARLDKRGCASNAQHAGKTSVPRRRARSCHSRSRWYKLFRNFISIWTLEVRSKPRVRISCYLQARNNVCAK